jgi:hypothetical protein
MGNYATEYYAEDAVFPAVNEVLDGVFYGINGNNLEGTVVIGGGSGYPAVGDVRDAVIYGASNEFIGTLVLPAEADVESGVDYGAGGTEFTGTLVAGGGGDQWATDLVAGGYTGDEAGAVLLAILAKANLITAGAITANLPVTASGQLRGPILIGDDYLAANGRAFEWTIDARAGFSVGTMSCKFGGSNAQTGDSWEVAGSVTDNLDSTWTLSFDLPDTQTGELAEGLYRWSVEIISAAGANVTEVFSGKGVEVRAKQTTNA